RRSSKRTPHRPNGLGMLGSGMCGTLGKGMLGTSDDGFGRMLPMLGISFSIPGGSLAEPRTALNDSADNGPLAVVIRYGPDGSSAITKLIVVRVVDVARLVSVTTWPLTPLPCTVSPLAVRIPPAICTWPAIASLLLT